MQQVVCRFAKGDAVKYISHLDLMRALERAMRRARLPLAYSEGFNPRPRVSYASALSVGHTSDAELMALRLTSPMDPSELRTRLNACLPEGLAVLQAWATPPHQPKTSLGEMDAADYVVRIEGPLAGKEPCRRASEFMEREEVRITRVRDKGSKDLDLRPLVSAIEVVRENASEAELHLRLRTGSSGGARPEEVLAALGIGGREFRTAIHRSALYASGSRGRAVRQRLRRLRGE
ncbi:MAG TPA: TIGR03936 family radical SAM-associated protein [Armatimonadota bacterium]|nr:TIGR03936 family radical SAM-associated protein [Armatimonadota bacterium]